MGLLDRDLGTALVRRCAEIFGQQPLAFLSGPELVESLGIVSGGADKLARFWSVSATRVFVADDSKVTDVAFLPDGTQLATAGADMLVKLWDLEGKPVRQLAGAKAPLARMTIRGQGAQLSVLHQLETSQ